MRTTRLITFAAAIAVVGALGACSGSASDDGGPATTAGATEQAGPVASYPDAAWMGKSLHLHAETEEGWIYDDEFSIDVPTVEFGKDISNSPPGQAVLTSFMSGAGAPRCWRTIPTDNGDRVGPDLCVTAPELIFPFKDFDSLGNPDEVKSEDVYWQDLQAGCDVAAMAGPEYLACGPQGSGNSKTYDLPEDVVDAFLADIKGIRPGVRVKVDEDVVEFNSEGELTRYPISESSIAGPAEQPTNPWYDQPTSYKAIIG